MLRVGILAERDDTDGAIIHTLVSRLLARGGGRRPVEPLYFPTRESGHGRVHKLLPVAAAFFLKEGAAGMVIVRDQDSINFAHGSDHSRRTRVVEPGCQVCRLAAELLRVGRKPALTAIGVPVCKMEAWMLFASRRLADPDREPCAGLKRMLFGTPHPSRSLTRKRCLPLAETVGLHALARASTSFRLFARGVLHWRPHLT